MSRPREEWMARGVEFALLVVLLALLLVALSKFARLLDRLDVPWTRGLPVAGLFAVSAYVTGRRIVCRLRTFRTGKGDGITGPQDR
jgi:hypothetical protein